MNKPKRWFAGKLRWALVVSLALHASVFALVLLPGDKTPEIERRPDPIDVDVIIPENKLPPPASIEPEPAPPVDIHRNAIFTDRFEVVPDPDANDNVIWDPNAVNRQTPELPDGHKVIVEPENDPNKTPEITYVDYQVPPTLINEVKPQYPEMAAASGIEADVVLLVYISESGDVEHVVVQGSSGFGSMDDEAIKAAKKCKFSPALQNGRPVAVWYSLVMEFRE
jgi:TonB family protein